MGINKDKKDNKSDSITENDANEDVQSSQYTPMNRDRSYFRDLTGENHPVSMKDTDPRFIEWDEEFIKYGFDSREIWNVDYSMLVALYERLKMFQEYAPVELVSDVKGFTVGKKEYSQQELFNKLVCLLEELLTADDFWMGGKKIQKKMRRVWKMWGLISPSIWW